VRLEQGRDRLLELHSYRPDDAALIVHQIQSADNDNTLELFILDLFRYHGVFAEPLGKRTYKLWSESPLDESFPALRTSRPLVTFDRSRGLAREDIEFMTADHPAVQSGIDMFLGSEKGNCCCARWKSGGKNELLLDAVFVVDCIAPPGLNVERFLPSTPVRTVVDRKLQDRSDLCKKQDFENSLQETHELSILEDNGMKTSLLPLMLKQAHSLAHNAAMRIIKEAIAEMRKIVGSEFDRITALAKVNPYIRQDEIDAVAAEILKLDTAISGAAPRIDSIRLIALR
jgi:ATP-dependent helicase HepA